jgi:dTDP-4-dehydrorhamnose reductase
VRILITGGEGQVGWELRQQLTGAGEVVAVGRAELDLTKPAAISDFVRQLRPEVIINAAAYTAVDRAESEVAMAHAVNAEAPGVLAVEAQRLGALLVHYSTDYVFSGDAGSPYRESDPVSPMSVYGRSKEEGERRVRAAGCRHLILRTAWVYGTRGKNFLLTMLRLADERERLRVVSDQVGSPTWSWQIAETTIRLIEQAGAAPMAETVNLTAGGQTSWHGFASKIVERGAGLGLCPLIPVDAINTADYPTPARRPAYSVLAGDRLRDRFGLSLPDWEVSLDRCLGSLAAARAAAGPVGGI